ncbi:glycosyltransferase [Ramlibacter sp. XY19]|uniref:glycosyltransferase family 4 protein n=1 Tax=Ramlibacter paludis TaxID=2908000 RepID=UPI0023DBA120|nr:glycosyltransferase [Ramlibacter paludis]MCG2591229.1 glycosyltransferase [Ramlibacter paludis]
MIFLTLVSAAVAFALCLVFIRAASGHARRYAAKKPQRFHVGDVPRIGGVAVLLGVSAGWLTAVFSNSLGHDQLNTGIGLPMAVTWLVILLPTALGGTWEDVTQDLSIELRFGMTGLSAALSCWLLDVALVRTGLPIADAALSAFPALTVLLGFTAVLGLQHAFNLIDGYNGLAGTVALLICLALAHVALQNKDRELAGYIICVAGATAGFLVWNYPRGSIFAGDGGAYLWGLVISVASLQLVQRHPEVSPWFPLLLVIYPVWETFFSIYRKMVKGTAPGVADALHFHQLIYRRIVRNVLDEDRARRILRRNNRTSPYLWGFTILSVGPAVLFWSYTPALVFFCLLFAFSYVSAYLMIVRFKVPRWIRALPGRRRPHRPAAGRRKGKAATPPPTRWSPGAPADKERT